jgi:hypothetical protein
MDVKPCHHCGQPASPIYSGLKDLCEDCYVAGHFRDTGWRRSPHKAVLFHQGRLPITQSGSHCYRIFHAGSKF